MTIERIELHRTHFGPTSLGALIEAMSHCREESHVSFDFCNLVPMQLKSYRGYYDHLALGWHEPNGVEYPTVKQFLAQLRAADGRYYEGYKGGTSRMDTQTPIWVANWGNCSDTGIVGISPTSNFWVTLLTEKVDE